MQHPTTPKPRTHFRETMTAAQYRVHIDAQAAAQIGPGSTDEEREEAQEWANDCWTARFGG